MYSVAVNGVTGRFRRMFQFHCKMISILLRNDSIHYIKNYKQQNCSQRNSIDRFVLTNIETITDIYFFFVQFSVTDSQKCIQCLLRLRSQIIVLQKVKIYQRFMVIFFCLHSNQSPKGTAKVLNNCMDLSIQWCYNYHISFQFKRCHYSALFIIIAINRSHTAYVPTRVNYQLQLTLKLTQF